MELESSLPHSQEPATSPILSHSYPVRDSLPHVLKINFNIILPSTNRSIKWTLSIRSPHQNPVFTSPVPYTCHMPRPSSTRSQTFMLVMSAAKPQVIYIHLAYISTLNSRIPIYIYLWSQPIIKWLGVRVSTVILLYFIVPHLLGPGLHFCKIKANKIWNWTQNFIYRKY